jgi:hypothetical protein
VRQPILYADQLWQRQRFWAFFLIVAGVAAIILLYVQLHRLSGSNLIWLLYVPSGLVLIGALQFYKRRHRLEVHDDGVLIGNLLSTVLVDYERIRGARVQPLKTHFQEGRRRLVNSMTKPLMEQPALFLKLRGEEELAYFARKLGPRLYHDASLALPIPDPDAAAWEITSRLPERPQVNMGGGRRRKRRR